MHHANRLFLYPSAIKTVGFRLKSVDNPTGQTVPVTGWKSEIRIGMRKAASWPIKKTNIEDFEVKQRVGSNRSCQVSANVYQLTKNK
jgi:hypothetical protein